MQPGIRNEVCCRRREKTDKGRIKGRRTRMDGAALIKRTWREGKGGREGETKQVT